jgi:hypothetical protein
MTEISNLTQKQKIILAQDPSTPKEIIESFFGEEDINWRLAIYQNDPDILKRLSKDKFYPVRRHVAGNSKSPEDVLIKLATDKIWDVRMAVAKNINIPEKAVNILLKDTDSVKASLAENKHISVETLDKLARGDNYLVKISVSLNPKTSAETLLYLFTGDFEYAANFDFKKVILSHSNCPGLLKTFA